MAKTLIIGGSGFVGAYLIRQLKDINGDDVCVTKLPNETIKRNDIGIYDLDILDKNSIAELLREVAPQHIYHLAAQSSVALSWKEPQLTVDINIKGCVNVLEAVRESALSPRILLIGSGEEYGRLEADEIPVREDTAVRPGNIYAATKVCQNLIGKIYSDAYGMDIMMVRAFNHVGPNQAPIFVVSDFCKQVADIEAGKNEPVIHVGNLSAKRDFTDVRDVVRAYSMIMESGRRGSTYNVGSGHAIAVSDILDKILSLSTADIKVEVDAARLRPVDVPVIEADCSALFECTGWTPVIPLEKTLEETLDYWRGSV